MEQKKFKISVYAIAKNEEKFVNRWVHSMKEADEIVVLDTGSTDKTVEKLKSFGVKVGQKTITPWRFDRARNESLKLVSKDTDICVCTDLDEVFEPNWRSKLEKSWAKGTKQARYKYVWNILENGQDGVTFFYEKIHALKNFKWVYPVHEILDYSSNEPRIFASCEEIVLRHFPDPNKSRSYYLPLLELAVKEHPESDRNTHYLGREYFFCGKYIDAIKTFEKHLKMKSSTWKEERSSSLRYMGDCYFYQKKFGLAQKYYKKAIVECPNVREGYLSLAKFYFETNDFLLSIFTFEKMLSVNFKNLSYMTNPQCWNDFPYDMLSMCYYNLNNFLSARLNCEKALLLNPTDTRIKNNLEFFTQNSKPKA